METANTPELKPPHQQQRDSTLKTMTSEQVGQMAKERFLAFRKKPFIVDAQNEKIFQLLCWYFAQDEQFTQAGYDLNKGIFLRGPIGCGKTAIMEAFTRNPLRWYEILPCRKLIDFYIKGGLFGTDDEAGIEQLILDPGWQLHQEHTPTKSQTPMNKPVGICLDDLGTEPLNVKHYGSELPVMEIILQDRYDLHIEGAHHRTHITSNLEAVTIKKTYGLRVNDRLREQFNTLAFHKNSETRRK